jgi:hypothetical protein
VTGVITKAVMTGYDQMGRLLSEQRCMGIFDCAGGGYGMSYTYDLAGKLASYLSGIGGFSFTNAYDASGHLLTFNASQGSQPTPTPLFSQPFYTPAGALKQLTLGTSINMIRTYDSRQRVTSETNSGGNNGGTTSGRGAVTILGSEQSY